MKFLFLNPFSGGSHLDFANGLIEHSSHEIDLISLPARFWKWRMRGAALYFIEKINSGFIEKINSGFMEKNNSGRVKEADFKKKIEPLVNYDGIIVTDMMSLADFAALAGGRCPPALVYFHENQITYPLAPGEARDFQFGFTNISSACAGQRILFNSHTHRDDFFAHLPGFLKMMPERRPMWVVDSIREKSGVIYPGCRFSGKMEPVLSESDASPLIIWNHRWEFDKNPDDFFGALARIQEKGHDFRLALLGENFQKVPKAFIQAKKTFGDKIVRYGYVESKKEYMDILKQGSMVISSAWQENFGISVIEAARCGCFPLLPNRLSYPEIIPAEFHGQTLFRDARDLEEKLSLFMERPSRFDETREKISRAMGVFSWENVIHLYDEALEMLARQG